MTDFLPHLDPPMKRIIKATSTATGVSVRDIMGSRKDKRIIRARFAAIVICRDYTGASLPEIGRTFNRHHTTILSAIRRLDEVLTDRDLDAMEAIARKAGVVEGPL